MWFCLSSTWLHTHRERFRTGASCQPHLVDIIFPWFFVGYLTKFSIPFLCLTSCLSLSAPSVRNRRVAYSLQSRTESRLGNPSQTWHTWRNHEHLRVEGKIYSLTSASRTKTNACISIKLERNIKWHTVPFKYEVIFCYCVAYFLLQMFFQKHFLLWCSCNMSKFLTRTPFSCTSHQTRHSKQRNTMEDF